MAESSRFWVTNATGDGPGGGYTQQQFYDFMRKVFLTDQEATRGVVFGEQGALACTGTASPIAVSAGSAIVYGFFYENTASVNLTVTTPSVGTTGGRVILRAGWTAQTVRLVAVRNTDGTIAIPALTQSAGTTWEISLATFTITTGGVITLTDDRKYLELGGKVIPDGVETASIKDANVTTAKIANLNVTQGLLAIGASKVTGRQGGSASNWDTIGSSNYTPTTVRIQAGAGQTSAGATVTTNFPVAFSNVPLVFVCAVWETGEGHYIQITPAADSFTIDAFTDADARLSIKYNWLAIGPE
jgi:hypothetical protein